MRAGVLAVFLLIPSALGAQEMLPGLYDVTGVAADDVLNIRQYPGGSSDIIGTISADATSIEVVGQTEDGGWAEIQHGEGRGYVAWRFLAAQDNPPWPDLQLPMLCLGTEPFWSMTFDPLQQTFALEMMGEESLPFALTSVIRTEGRRDIQGWQFDGPERTGFATLRGDYCSDGMSDRAFGLVLDLFLLHAGGPRGLTGCCTLDVD